MGKPNLAARLAGVRPCGCTAQRPCQQHWQALSREEQRAHIARLKLLARGEDPDPGREVAT